MFSLTTWIQILFLATLLWSLSKQVFSENPIIWNSDAVNLPSVLLLTAHPDDECMFFAPSILALTRGTRRIDEVDVHIPVREERRVYSLCLSTGDADGLGLLRKQELRESLDVLGIPEERSWVLDRPFKDNITAFWDAGLIADYVRPYVVDNKIDIILTFDEHGVSSHPNHISLLHGVHALLADPPRPGLHAFSLKTTTLISKYFGPLSASSAKLELAFCASPIAPTIELLASTHLAQLGFVASAMKILTQACKRNDYALFLSGWREYLQALHAMRKHDSQLVWFRWLYVSFSQYMWVNTLELIELES